jgi:DNA-binding transcriptional LysR family regulator
LFTGAYASFRSRHAYQALKRGDLVEVLPHLQVPNKVEMALFYPHRTGLAPRVRVLVDFLLQALASTETLHQPG